MSLRKKVHADYPAIKRSRSGYTGNLTKLSEKLSEMMEMDLSQVNIRTVEGLVKSCATSETRYLNTLDEAHTFLSREEGAEDLLEEEEAVVDQFQQNVADIKEQAATLISLKGCAKSQRKLSAAVKAVRDAFSVRPEADQSSALRQLTASYDTLLTEWDAGNHDEKHPLLQRIEETGAHITQLTCEMAGVREHTPAPTHDLSTSFSLTGGPTRLRTPKLPTLELPTFNGEVMKWASFWTAFSNQVGTRDEISDSDKLIYLRKAIKHQPTQDLLEAPREEEDSYAEVVKELKRRFDLPKEVHKNLVQRIMQLVPIKETQDDIKRLMDSVRRTLLSLKRTGSYCLESFMTSVVFLVLPKKLQILWEQNTKKEKKVTGVFTMLDFFLEHAATLTPSSLTQSYQATKPETQNKKPRQQGRRHENAQPHRQKATVHVSSTPASPSYKWECQLCPGEKHPLYLCTKWLEYSITQRLAHVRTKSLCHNCLAVGHAAANCRSTYRCRDCQQPHHTTIHQTAPAPTTQVNYSSRTQTKLPDALMMTAQVTITGPGGHTLPARALIDSGAGMSLVSSRVAQSLKLKLHKADLQFSGVQGTPCKAAKHITNLCISPVQANTPSIKLAAAVVSHVTNDLPTQDLSIISDLPHISQLNLADPSFHTPGKIDLLLGADVYHKLLGTKSAIIGASTGPAAVDTIFGWAMTGPVPTQTDHIQAAPTIHESLTPADLHLDNQMARFWDAEQVDTGPVPHTPVEDQVQLHYSNTTSYCSDSRRYTVTLPRNSDVPALGESAMSRYISNERSILRRNIWGQFQAVVQSYLDLGHAEPISPTETLPEIHYYLPMHSVAKHTSTSTKLRVVFDGSATTSNGISLNQSLLVGPTLHPTLGSILIKFRSYPIAITSDISKMYREVALAPEDKDLHRFLWRAKPEDPIQDFRMTRVTFGVSASPYLAVRTLQQAAKDHGEGYPDAVQHILMSFYVDDLLAGADTPEEAKALYQQLRDILGKAGFNLCKWRSSSNNVLCSIPIDLQETMPVKEMAESQATYPKALGLEWVSRLDLMAPAIQPPEHYSKTKRGVVSDVSKTFDILGWIAPAVLTMKLLYQQLWQLKTGWDEPIPPDLIKHHSTWREQLPILSSKRLPRCYFRTDVQPLTKQLHCFADASLKAYGAVLYLRSTYKDHPPLVSLLISKTRVAKLKPSTVPRQELCAAVLLTELLSEVKETLQIPEENVYCWSDSSIVLSWLDGHPRDYKIFVTNRVNSVLQVSSPQQWRHVPTAENPADCASRGMMPADLLTHDLWWQGPEWLHQDPISIPWQPPRKPLLAPELRLPATINAITQAPPPFLELRYSNYHRLISITAWCLRFIARLTKRTGTSSGRHLTANELNHAEHTLARLSQKRSFPREQHALLHDRAISHCCLWHPTLTKNSCYELEGGCQTPISQFHKNTQWSLMLMMYSLSCYAIIYTLCWGTVAPPCCWHPYAGDSTW